MNKLNIKWKLFLILNYVQLVFFVLFIIVLVFFAFNQGLTRADYLSYTLVLLLFLFLSFNNALNIHAVNKYFPNKLIPSRQKRLLVVSWILNIITLGSMLFISISTMYFAIADNTTQTNNTGLILALTLSFLSFIAIYTFILQFQIIPFLNRNNRSNMNDLIDSIGT